MKTVEWGTNSLEELVAFDELLLNKAESGEIGEVLRFWSSNQYLIAVGRSGKVSEDCSVDECRRDGIKIIRRISGGGSVLQGPGCINYSAILSYDSAGEYRDIRTSYQSILQRLADSLRKEGHDVNFFPICDLALSKKKISGNAQARKKKFFLHHGTFLISFDLDKVPRYLKHPSKEPEYRNGRSHKDFLANISISREELEHLIKETFSATEGRWIPGKDDLKELKNLVDNKYRADKWNYAF